MKFRFNFDSKRCKDSTNHWSIDETGCCAAECVGIIRERRPVRSGAQVVSRMVVNHSPQLMIIGACCSEEFPVELCSLVVALKGKTVGIEKAFIPQVLLFINLTEDKNFDQTS